jgi:maltose O-acetyltransferase
MRLKRVVRKILLDKNVRNLLGSTYYTLRDSYYQMNYAEYRTKFAIHPSFQFRGEGVILWGDEGTIALAENSYISRNCILEALSGCKIIVGKNCAIGPNVKMYTAGRATDQDLNYDPFGEHKIADSKGDIIIGDGCWMGADVCIKGGVRIGTNSIVGMNSVVTHDIPPHCLAVGNPARVVKFKSYLTKDERAKLVSEYWTSLSDAIKGEDL